MKYTFKQIYNSVTPEKRKSDGTITAVLYRPLGYPVSWIFLNLGIQANTITLFSALCCIVAFFCTLFPASFLHWVAIILFGIFAVGDCADGTMARTAKKQTTYGGWADAAAGYLAYATILLSLGLSAFFQNGNEYTIPFTNFALPLFWGSATWILLGAIAAITNTTMRLFHQAFKNASLAAGIETKPGTEKRFSEEIGITGYLPILYAVGFATKNLPLVLFAYTAIYSAGFFVTSIQLMQKVHRN